jgi:hypothetical protein
MFGEYGSSAVSALFHPKWWERDPRELVPEDWAPIVSILWGRRLE